MEFMVVSVIKVLEFEAKNSCAKSYSDQNSGCILTESQDFYFVIHAPDDFGKSNCQESFYAGYDFITL